MDIYNEKISVFKKQIDEYISDASFKNFVSKYQSEYFMENYFDYLVYSIIGGKCIRGYLVKLGYDLFCNEPNIDITSLVKLASSYEIYEGSILAHDDIVDVSELRRNKPSLYMHMGEGKNGVDRCIFLADAGMFLSNAIVLDLDIESEQKIKILKHQNLIFLSTLSGELKDIDMSYSDLYDEEDVLLMYNLKTSLYTISGPLMLGAICANVDNVGLNSIKKIGYYIGVSFQIIDDILGIFGDAEVIGKSVSSDISEGKKTILTAHFDKHSDDDMRREFYSIYGKKKSVSADEKLLIMDLLNRTGSLKYAKEYAERYLEIAKKSFYELKTNAEAKEEFLEFCNYMLNRQK